MSILPKSKKWVSVCTLYVLYKLGQQWKEKNENEHEKFVDDSRETSS